VVGATRFDCESRVEDEIDIDDHGAQVCIKSMYALHPSYVVRVYQTRQLNYLSHNPGIQRLNRAPHEL
jgi:hypothetical protein